MYSSENLNDKAWCGGVPGRDGGALFVRELPVRFSILFSGLLGGVTSPGRPLLGDELNGLMLLNRLHLFFPAPDTTSISFTELTALLGLA